ncbi:MAG: 50S ribosomal protein L11 methyltransferase [Candidatus Cloacimonadota bacterium]|nr:MAG: 50S ribosomal protein L11 methyltransferase [Candidatus Cloacimonadota bacterium]PIE79158.1 MAG: 50S ribosomal protein L11 methyltransferase [Candidatus Delongbacteria bacterium]
MDWKSVEILNINNDIAKEVISSLAFDYGCGGVEDNEGSFFYDGSRESNSGLKLYFPEDSDIESFIEKAKTVLKDNGVDEYKILTDDIENRNWREEWKKSYKPLDAGDFTIIPSWIDHKTNKIPIKIEPKMAFGTGTHETTQMLLEMMKRDDVEGKDILDAGTGSGILAIAAVKLNAKSVVANDIEEESIDNAVENGELNGVKDSLKVDFVKDDEYTNPNLYDTLFANINRSVLVDLMAGFKNVLRVGGTIFLSGILIDENQFIKDSLKLNNFEILDYKEKNEWCSFKAKRL